MEAIVLGGDGMPQLQDKELFTQLKQEKLAPVYFLYGAESYFVRSAAQKIMEKASGGMQGFNLQRFPGDKLEIGELEDACEVLPMMAEKRCVAVMDLDVDKMAKGDFDRLMALFSNPYDATVLLLFQPNQPVDLKKSARYKKLSDTAAKSGVTCEFGLKDRNTLRRALCERAKKSYISMDMQTAGALVERCSANYAILLNELDKLISHSQNGEITEKDVEECCVRSIDASSFDLAKNILSRNYDRAFQLLDELFSLRQEAISILGALSMAFSDIYRAKCASSAGRSPETVATDFRYPKNRLFAIRNAFRDIHSFSAGHIRDCIAALYEADRALKSSRLDERLILEQTLGKMLLSSIGEHRI